MTFLSSLRPLRHLRHVPDSTLIKVIVVGTAVPVGLIAIALTVEELQYRYKKYKRKRKVVKK